MLKYHYKYLILLISGLYMIVRNCSGGIVFVGDKVLLVCNDKHEWSFPKGTLKVASNITLPEFAKQRVKIETDVDAKVIAPCGKTNYEFYSVTRRKPVHNNVSWFVMETQSEHCKADPESGTINCRFVEINKALDEITYSQDKSLLMMAYQKYRESAKA